MVLKERQWTMFTNHGAVFIYLMEHPEATIRTISDELGLAERTVVGLLHDLKNGDYLLVSKSGRNNVYRVNPGGLMKRPEHSGYTLKEFVDRVQEELTGAALSL